MFHRDGTLPSDSINGSPVIFVFGSNTAGRHGAGAAKIARERFGARYGVGRGLTGSSYAIATKRESDERPRPGEKPALVVLPLELIRPYVDELILFAQAHPSKTFFVTRLGCGLAGYKDIQIAPMFERAGANFSFAKEWHPFLADRSGLRPVMQAEQLARRADAAPATSAETDHPEIALSHQRHRQSMGCA